MTRRTTPEHEEHSLRDGGFTQQTTRVFVERPDPEGVLVVVGWVQVSVCTTCLLVEAQCEHTKSSWNEEGTKLTCNLCGIDGT